MGWPSLVPRCRLHPSRMPKRVQAPLATFFHGLPSPPPEQQPPAKKVKTGPKPDGQPGAHPSRDASPTHEPDPKPDAQVETEQATPDMPAEISQHQADWGTKQLVPMFSQPSCKTCGDRVDPTSKGVESQTN